ncbi:MAG TPA: AMP-binding protein [Alphaproteobacteria bacterium]|nr:AMP-binding protein [Alphaproteobacteria bacterium]
MSDHRRPSTTDPDPNVTEATLLDLINRLAHELHPHRAGTVAATLDSSLERELGFDSLGRVELLQRLERAFAVTLPDRLLATAETPRDLLRAIQTANKDGQPLQMSPISIGVSSAPEATSHHATTIVELLHWHVQSHPERLYLYLYGETGSAQEMTYGDLFEGAMAVAGGLRARGLEPGQTAALMLPTGGDFFSGFYGILLAGGIPVPLYPPARWSQIEDHLRRQAGILTNAQAALLITVPEAQRLARLLRSQVGSLHSVVTVAELAADRKDYSPPTVLSQDIALLQYTSGSTGMPKGVILTHANLLANIRIMGQVAKTTAADVFVSWLPLYHDMGLIGACLGSLYHGCPLVLMSPLSFLARPERWLWAIHTHRGTISAAPNFAYELCLRRLDEHAFEGLDLSSWRLALNGAEPISPDTITRFCERFAPYGFRPEAITPVYGLAESSLGLAFPPPGRGLCIDRVKREPFQRAGRAEPAADDDPTMLRFVSCGYPLPGHQIRIVDDTGYEAAERQVGRLQFKGPSVTSGYFRNAEATQRLFDGDWLDSGDLAYIASGEVYLTGRAKDLIIRAGRNIYPHELEDVIGDLPGIRKGCVAVFGSSDPVSGTERLVVLAETRETDAARREQLHRQIDAVVVDVLGMPADDVVLAPPQTVLKTSSGKIRRADCRARYERGDLGGPPRAVWWQLTRLALAGARPQLRRMWQHAGQALYAGYAWTQLGICAAVLWIAIALLPRLSWRRTVARVVTQQLLRMVKIPVVVRGGDHLRQDRPCVLVTNHASYMDALVLIAVLPTWVSFVAKRELTRHFFPRVLFQRLGTEFVERFDAQRGVEDTERVLQAVRTGRSMLFFPEGTFKRAPGLLPFRMGAFVVAAQAGVPVVPMAINGTRSILRAEQWLPRRGTVSVTIGAPILPQGTDWSAAVALRDAARAQILRYSGEPDLAQDFTPGPPSPRS